MVQNNQPSEAHPTLTIAVCTYRRFAHLDRCLTALTRQADEGVQIIVIDNSCDERLTAHSREKWSAARNLRYIVTDRAGLSRARNRAVTESGNDFLAFVDDDAIPREAYVASLKRAIREYGDTAGVIGGPAFPLWERSPPPWLTDSLRAPLAIIDWGPDSFELGSQDQRWLVGANICYQQRLLEAIGGFPEEIGRIGSIALCHEELAATKAIQALGAQVFYDPAIAVDHWVQKDRMTPAWLIQDAFWEAVSRTFLEARDLASLSAEPLAQLQAIAAEKLPDLMPRGGFSTADLVQARTQAAEVAAEVAHSCIRAPRNPAGTPAGTNEPDLILVIPVLNRLAQLQQTINNLLLQTGSINIHISVKDGGSQDGTTQYLLQLQQDLHQRNQAIPDNRFSLEYSSGVDTGLYDALLSVAITAHETPMSWIGAGDLFAPGALASIVRTFKRSPEINWVIPPCFVLDRGVPIRFTQTQYPRQIIEAGLCDGVNWPIIQQEGSFWRAKLWSRCKDVMAGYSIAGDWRLWKEFARTETPLHLKWPVASFSIESDQLSSDYRRYQREIDASRSAREVAKAINRVLQRATNLTVSVLEQDYTLDWKPLDIQCALRDGKHEVLPRRLAKEMASTVTIPSSIEQATARDLLIELGHRDPKLLRKINELTGPAMTFEKKSLWYRCLRYTYRLIPDAIRTKLRPTVRRLF